MLMADGMFCSPVILARLEVFFADEDGDGLVAYLDGLSHRDFRMAGEIMSTRIMPHVSDRTFWYMFLFLFRYRSRAFLGTLLKSVPLRRNVREFTLRCDAYLPLAVFLNNEATEVDRTKFITFMVGVCGEDLDELTFLFSGLHIDSPHERMNYLLRDCGMASYYMLFQCMRQLEHERELLVRCCSFLMKKGDAFSFNLASVVRVYFDLTAVKGTFSLRLMPYQLSSLEASFEGFVKVMRSIS